jgi:hypothetical protein
MKGEPVTALPGGRLIASAVVAAGVAGIVWFIASSMLGADAGNRAAGLYGAGIAAIAMTAGLLILGPWIARPIGMWMTLWLAGMVARFVIALALAWVLYSATSVSPWSLVGGVGGPYFAALLTEVIVLAGFMSRTPQQA